ncbi:histidine kinase [Sphingomonas sp. Root710]|uniref:ATP-binding protein n=1 Tax=Sphingomonas sp. Root710 TaxID=1736594 RepID=UPI0006FDF152|nr:ATP-binding protein [Sphingomonas sp. Root710]KRB82959.1 histidine kinase [Sphingomonas sp. Root710]
MAPGGGVRWGGLSIFWQTLLLLLASVAVVFVVTVGLFLTAPPPRPDFNSLSDIAEALSGRKLPRERYWDSVNPHGSHARRTRRYERDGGDAEERERERRLTIVERPAEPRAEGEMISSGAFSERLAARIGVPADDVRLYFEPDQRSNMPFRSRDERRVIVRRGEPIFFDTVVAGLRTDGGWRVVRTPPRAWIAPWQKRILVLFGLSVLVMIPFAWIFARALARPIRRIADAADRLGANPQAPQITEEGPAELRVTAHALNRMQQRLSAYLAERTNMIGAIAHDLRTPLARIAFRIEGAPDDIRERVQADIEQMRAMIAATISFVRDTGSISVVEPVALGRLLDDLVGNEREIGRKAVLGAVEPIEVSGDPMALRRLFQNLIDNGVAYGGGVEISLTRAGDEAEVRIADSGPGLPAAALEAMFRPFERGEPSRNRATGGIGLGLSIARAIAQEHGGSLVLANRTGGGLVAICRLPIRF